MSTTTNNNFFGKPAVVTFVMVTLYPKQRRPMYCVNCGHLMEFTYKKVVMIIQGVADIEKIDREMICRKCKAVYEIC